MIGQSKLLSRINSEDWVMPKFLIIIGPRQSGKKMLAKYIAKRENAILIPCSNKVDEVREVITMAHKLVAEKCIFMFSNAEKMHPSAKNALLKVTEETPNSCKIIMTATDINDILPTLQSRGFIQYMEPYKQDELIKLAEDYGVREEHQLKAVANLCITPGEVKIMASYDIDEFYYTVDKVLNYLPDVSPANGLKITQSISFKPEDPGWDYILFLRAFMNLCNARAACGSMNHQVAYTIIRNTINYIGDFKVNGINKAAVFDLWLLEIMGVLGNDIDGY